MPIARWAVGLFVGVCLAKAAAASTIHVPADSPTIQGAINSAVSGDIIIVADGLYYEHLNFRGKAITVTSQLALDSDTSHISATIIDGSHLGPGDTGSVVIFCSGESSQARLRGFTIRGGTGTSVETYEWGEFYAGGGILVTDGSPVISQCRIRDNSDEVFVIGDYASASLVRCVIDGQVTTMEYGWCEFDSSTVGWVAGYFGGSVSGNRSTISGSTYVEFGNATLTGSICSGDMYCYRGGAGADSCTLGSAVLYMDGTLDIRNSLVLTTVTGDGYNGGVWLSGCTILGKVLLGLNGQGPAEIDHCILLDTFMEATSGLTISYTIFDKPVAIRPSTYRPLDTVGVYRESPQFCSGTGGNYEINDNSRAAPQNNPSHRLIGAFGIGCSCCIGMRGNVDNRSIVELNDLSMLVAYLTTTTGPAVTLPCRSSADVNGSGSVDLTDLAVLIAYLTGDSGSMRLPVCPSGVSQT